MPVEIEIKMKVADLALIRAKLKSIQAQFASSVLETNTFFDTPDQKLLKEDKGLRIRHARDTQSGSEKAIITFKGPRQPGAAKTREEREVVVDNLLNGIALLDALGFVRVLTFQKRRESWALADCKIELDELPRLGFFVEIEGPSEQSIHHCQELLGMTSLAHIASSYASMLIDDLKKQGTSERIVTFK